MNKSNQGKFFIISKDIYIQSERNKFILYINSDIKKDLKIMIKKQNTLWYGTSFNFYKENPFHGDNTIKIPTNLLNKGLYITHWEYGDSLYHNNMNKKVSDIFINNKISNYKKKYYPIVRDKQNNILWIPNIVNKFYTENKDVLYANWIEK